MDIVRGRKKWWNVKLRAGKEEESWGRCNKMARPERKKKNKLLYHKQIMWKDNMFENVF